VKDHTLYLLNVACGILLSADKLFVVSENGRKQMIAFVSREKAGLVRLLEEDVRLVAIDITNDKLTVKFVLRSDKVVSLDVERLGGQVFRFTIDFMGLGKVSEEVAGSEIEWKFQSMPFG